MRTSTRPRSEHDLPSVWMLIQATGGGGGDSTLVECLFSIDPLPRPRPCVRRRHPRHLYFSRAPVSQPNHHLQGGSSVWRSQRLTQPSPLSARWPRRRARPSCGTPCPCRRVIENKHSNQGRNKSYLHHFRVNAHTDGEKEEEIEYRASACSQHPPLPCPPGCRARTGTCPRASPPTHATPCRRVIENKHSTEIRARLTFRVNAYASSGLCSSIRRRSSVCSQRFPAEEEEEIQCRSSACSHYAPCLINSRRVHRRHRGPLLLPGLPEWHHVHVPPPRGSECGVELRGHFYNRPGDAKQSPLARL